MKSVRKLASCLKFDARGLDTEQPARDLIDRLLNPYGFAATQMILARAGEFAQQNGKKLLVIIALLVARASRARR